MGTNYYFYEKPPCPTCGHAGGERKHIGKSSGGWCFSLHVDPDDGINSLDDWKHLFAQPGSYIKDEYGDQIPPPEMLEIITNRKWRTQLHGEQFHRENHSQPGPNGLLRHQIGSHCVGHGEGTWDLIRGEFS